MTTLSAEESVAFQGITVNETDKFKAMADISAQGISGARIVALSGSIELGQVFPMSDVLNGWIENHRDHGQLLFLDLRDRYGVTQIVVDQETPEFDADAFDRVRRLGAEDVLSVRGRVRLRDADKINENRSTGPVPPCAWDRISACRLRSAVLARVRSLPRSSSPLVPPLIRRVMVTR